jgi:hypothetical protein
LVKVAKGIYRDRANLWWSTKCNEPRIQGVPYQQQQDICETCTRCLACRDRWHTE